MAKTVRNDGDGIVVKDAAHKENVRLRTSNAQRRNLEDPAGNSIGLGRKSNARNVPGKGIEDLSVAMIAGPALADHNVTEIVITNRIVSLSQKNRFLQLR